MLRWLGVLGEVNAAPGLKGGGTGLCRWLGLGLGLGLDLGFGFGFGFG